MTTKILALTDALGNLVRFLLLPGHRFDTVGVAPLIAGVEFGALLADKAFDSPLINQSTPSCTLGGMSGESPRTSRGSE
jgi:hypothetical protein